MATTEERKQKDLVPDCLNVLFPFSVTTRFPGDLEYIPAIRKFVADLLQVANFSPKFAYRSEIIIDEICNNAVTYGCRSENAEIELVTTLHEDGIEFTIVDQGGDKHHLKRLKNAAKADRTDKKVPEPHGIGLEIVRMLSERLDVVINEENLTSIHIVRKKETEPDSSTTRSNRDTQ
jgi:anti-sigma regulatory factor (Ser/Thr protein kinase)